MVNIKKILEHFWIIIILQIISISSYYYIPENIFTFSTIVLNLSCALYLLNVVWRYNFFNRRFYLHFNKKHGVLLAIILFLGYSNVITYLEVNNQKLGVQNLLYVVLDSFSTGLFEEVFFRLIIWGLLYHSFKYIQKNPIIGVTITSLIFALSHCINFLSPLFNAETVIIQILFAFVTGVIFQGLLFRTNNILFVATIHSFINFNGDLDIITDAQYTQVPSSGNIVIIHQAGEYNYVNTILFFLAMLILAYLFLIYILKRVSLPKIS